MWGVMTSEQRWCREDKGLQVTAREAIDNVTRYDVLAQDGLSFPCVYIRSESLGVKDNICTSTQIGCRRSCVLCESASLPLTRNLSGNEIAEAVRLVCHDQRIDAPIRVLFNGVGEPLDNRDEIAIAMRIMGGSRKERWADRRVRFRVSTSAPKGDLSPLMLMWNDACRFDIQLSLHAGTDDCRRRLIPHHRHGHMEKLARDVRAFWRVTGTKVWLNYVLLEGINDELTEATALIGTFFPESITVAISRYNKTQNTRLRPSSRGKQFLDMFTQNGVDAFEYETSGGCLHAACGQLCAGSGKMASRHQN